MHIRIYLALDTYQYSYNKQQNNFVPGTRYSLAIKDVYPVSLGVPR